MPDQWIVVEITHGGKKIRKVLAGWWGGFLGADSWRLSSGITEIVDQGDCYAIHNESGSVYTCHKNNYGTTGLSVDILSNWQKQALERDDVDIAVIDQEEISLK
jgi:hypothetical protein